MKLPYPKTCGQNWLEMEENDKGRLCSKCENTIVDFRAKNWNEIRQTQFNSNYTTCGLYTKKQLKNWDATTVQKSGIHAAAASVLFGLSQLISNQSHAQNTNSEIPVQIIDDTTKTEYRQTTQFYEIRGVVRDANNGEPLPFVTVIVNFGVYKTSTDFDGNYLLNLPVDKLINNKISLSCSFVGYEPITISDVVLVKSKYIELNFELNPNAELTYFVIEEPTKKEIRRAKKAKKKEEKRLKE